MQLHKFHAHVVKIAQALLMNRSAFLAFRVSTTCILKLPVVKEDHPSNWSAQPHINHHHHHFSPSPSEGIREERENSANN